MAAPPEIQHPGRPPITNQDEARPKPPASDDRQQSSQARGGAGPQTAASPNSNKDNLVRSWSTRAPPRPGTNGITLRNALVYSSQPKDEQSVPPLPVPRVYVPSEHMNGGKSSTASVGGPRPNLDTVVPTQVKATTPLKENGQLLRPRSAAPSQSSSKQLSDKKRELDDAVLPESKRRSMDQASRSLTPAGGQNDFLQKYLEVDAINKQNYLEADTINKGALAREVLDLRCENQLAATELDAALSDNGSLKQENETRLRKIKTLEAELATEKSQAGGLRKEVVSLREELASKKCRIGDLEKENAEMKDLKDGLESDVKAKAKTNTENTKLMHKMRSKAQESDQVMHKMRTKAQESDQEMAELKASVSSFEQKLKSMEREKEHASTSLKRNEETRISMLQKAETKYKTLETEKDNMSADLVNEKSARQKSENKAEKLHAERNNLSTELQSEVSARQKAENESKKTQMEKNKLSAELHNEISARQKSENEVKRLQNERDNLSAELRNEISARHKSENEVKRLQNERDNLSAELRDETSEKQKLAADLDQQGHSYTRQLEEQRARHDATVKKLTIESERSMQEKMVMRDQEYREFLDSSDAEKKQLRSTIDRLRRDRVFLLLRLDTLAVIVQRFDKEIDAKTGKLDQLRGSSPFATGKSITDSEKEIHSLNGQLTEKEAEVALHRSESKDSKYRLAEEEDKNRKAKFQISALEKREEEKEAKIVSLKSQNSGLKKKYEEEVAKVLSLQSELQRETFEQLRKQETTKHSVSCQTEPEERRATHTNLPPINTGQAPASPPASRSPPMTRRRSSTSSKTAEPFNPPSGPRSSNFDEDAEDGRRRQENWTGCKNRYCRLYLDHFGPCHKHARYCRLNSDHTGSCIVAFTARRGSYRQDDLAVSSRRRSRSPRRDSTYDSGYRSRGHDTWRR